MAYGERQSNGGGGFGWRAVAGISLLVLVGGLILAGWIVTRFDLWQGPSQPAETAPVATVPATLNPPDNAANQAMQNAKAQNANSEAVVAKVEELADRLSRIDTDTGPAGSYSARSEAVVTALSVRRAMERGAALGITESQLRLRFGNSHPKQVAAIQLAAQKPVSITNLRDELARSGAAMTGRGSDDSLWARISAEFAELFTLRQRGTPSRAPAQILQRAELRIANGDVRGAIEEVRLLRPNAATARWLADARRYQSAQDALDIIERAALSAPVEVPALPAPAAAPAIVPTMNPETDLQPQSPDGGNW